MEKLINAYKELPKPMKIAFYPLYLVAVGYEFFDPAFTITADKALEYIRNNINQIYIEDKE